MKASLTDLYLNPTHWVLHQAYYSVGKAVTQVNFDKIIDRISLVIYEHIFSLSLRLGAPGLGLLPMGCHKWKGISLTQVVKDGMRWT